ncbi:hypothetical protein [Scatolibacter rhodanostii]|uniref:hypothetical protein n=1 Tax=Scatolibacter rhodanostii TaxID=2014781 RepID=UPI000C08AAD0|nr:hypothetical protein [Scatolibacter rhodanostii]
MSKNKIDYHEHDEVKNYPNIGNVASANETTGLIPSLAQTNDEFRSYQDISSTAIPKKAPGKRERSEPLKIEPTRHTDHPYL